MKCYLHVLAAACVLAAGGVSLNAADVVTHDRTVVKADAKAASLALPAGIASKDLNATKGLEASVCHLAENALSKNGFDNIVAYLVDQDRNRLADKKNMKVDDLNGLVDKINGTLKSKYGQDFKADKKHLDGFVSVVTGEVQDPQLLVGKWPVKAGDIKSDVMNAVDKGTSPMDGRVSQEDADKAKNKLFGGDVNLEKGRNVALLHMPASHGVPAVTASMISEPTAWRFDIPNNISGDDLHANLLACLTELSNKSDWPADFAEAQRQVCHHVLAALYGLKHETAGMKTVIEK